MKKVNEITLGLPFEIYDKVYTKILREHGLPDLALRLCRIAVLKILKEDRDVEEYFDNENELKKVSRELREKLVTKLKELNPNIIKAKILTIDEYHYKVWILTVEKEGEVYYCGLYYLELTNLDIITFQIIERKKYHMAPFKLWNGEKIDIEKYVRIVFGKDKEYRFRESYIGDGSYINYWAEILRGSELMRGWYITGYEIEALKMLADDLI